MTTIRRAGPDDTDDVVGLIRTFYEVDEHPFDRDTVLAGLAPEIGVERPGQFGPVEACRDVFVALLGELLPGGTDLLEAGPVGLEVGDVDREPHEVLGLRAAGLEGGDDVGEGLLELAGEGRRMGLFLHHTDADREYAYDRNSHVGALDKVLDSAADNGWIIVDMKKDWKRIFPDLK